MRNTDSFLPWAIAVCPRWTCAVQYELCAVMCPREKCASARVQVGVAFTPPVTLTAVATGWVRKTSVKQNLMRTRQRSDFLVDGDNVELVVLSRLTQFPECSCDFQENASSRLIHSPLLWPLIVLHTRSPWRRTPPCWARWQAGWNGWLMMSFCVLFCPTCSQPLEVPLQWRITYWNTT